MELSDEWTNVWEGDLESVEQQLEMLLVSSQPWLHEVIIFIIKVIGPIHADEVVQDAFLAHQPQQLVHLTLGHVIISHLHLL
jgi:hypothetical protein